MECKYVDEISEEWILENAGVKPGDTCSTEELSLSGSIRLKIIGLGRSLVSFASLRDLDLSRNAIKCLDGLQYCQNLRKLNVYYNNISELSELMRLTNNGTLCEIDVRLNPVSTLSTEYRLLLVHALTNLQILDNVKITEKDRRLSLAYHDTEQAYQLKSYLDKENTDLRLQREDVSSVKSDYSSVSERTPCKSFIEDIRPPANILQPTRDAYDAYSARGNFTPNPKSKRERVESPYKEVSELESSPYASSPLLSLENRYKIDPILQENKVLKAKYNEYKEKYNKALSERISKENYIKLQEDYYRSLKKSEELEELYRTANTEVNALKQHVNNLTADNTALKQELKIKEQVTEVDKELKTVCKELQETLASDRAQHGAQIADYTNKYEHLAKTFTETLAGMEQKYEEERQREELKHKLQIQKCNDNFTELKQLIDKTKLLDT